MEDLDKLAVENFREYLRIPSVHPDVNYDECVTFIRKLAQSLELPVQVHYCFPNKPIVIITWFGKEPNLPSIMLNAHMDVVPVYEEQWTYPPFGAVMDKDGNIYARGTQDTKSINIQYLEAIRRLRLDNVSLKRTIHVSFMPDEEIGGFEGMAAFVNSEEFKNLNVGFILDEGMTAEDDVFPVFYAEKCTWVAEVHCSGQPGHGSLLLENTAGEKARSILNNFYNYRNQVLKKLKENPSLTEGDVTSINLTIVEGGVQSNVIPPEFTLTFDCRISINEDVKELEKTFNKWCEEAGEGVWIEYPEKEMQVPETPLDEGNLYWVAFKRAFDDMKLKLRPTILTGGTDSRFLRAVGIPALGFSPMINTIDKTHDHNEYLNRDVFLRGIQIYQKLIVEVANVNGNV